MKYLESNPEIGNGVLVIKGTRIKIAHVFEKLAAGMTVEYMLEGWPWLSEPQLTGAIQEAAKQLEAPVRDIVSDINPSHA
jgi:uncharacterized protein (DUF433 family)